MYNKQCIDHHLNGRIQLSLEHIKRFMTFQIISIMIAHSCHYVLELH